MMSETDMSESMESKLKDYFFQKRHFLILLFAVFLLGLLLGGSLYWHSKRQVADKVSQLAVLSDEKKVVLQKLAAVEVEARILRATQADLKKIIQHHEDEISKQATSLEFYRQLMVGEPDREGLDLNSYKIFTTDDPQTFQYQLTFVQYSKNHLEISVELTITVDGNLNGQPKIYNFTELMSQPSKDFGQINFKYFKLLEGFIKLPKGFNPRQIIVKDNSKIAKNWERYLIWHIEENK